MKRGVAHVPDDDQRHIQGWKHILYVDCHCAKRFIASTETPDAQSALVRGRMPAATGLPGLHFQLFAMC